VNRPICFLIAFEIILVLQLVTYNAIFCIFQKLGWYYDTIHGIRFNERTSHQGKRKFRLM